MPALPVMIVALCVFALGYRYYSAFLAAKVFVLDKNRVTPAHSMRDGQNYHPMSKWVLFGHHFAAISGAGPFKRTDWLPGNILTSTAVVFAWGYLIWNASISTIWPMFGIANQLLAAIALAIGAVILVKMKKQKYLWVPLIPMVFVAVTTITAGVQMITNHYWPKTATPFVVDLNVSLIAVIVGCSLAIFFSAFRKIAQSRVKGRAVMSSSNILTSASPKLYSKSPATSKATQQDAAL